MPNAILHAFNWPYLLVAEQAHAIAQAGYGAVLLPPILYSREDGEEWWHRYQPKDYRVLRSHLGHKMELAAALAALHAEGLKAYADVVFNHMANEKGQRDDPYHFPGAQQLQLYREKAGNFEKDRLYGNLEEGLFSPWDFNPLGDIQNWENRSEVEERWLGGLPDLDLNDWVIQQQQTCLEALVGFGFDGFRVDAIKHLPLEHIRRVFQGLAERGLFVFGEVLTTTEAQEATFLWPLLQETWIDFYDFPLFDTLRRALSVKGSLREWVDPAAYGQALPWDRAVTFTLTHDIPHNPCFRGQLLDPIDEYLAYAFLLGRDGGVPMIYSDHDESALTHPEDQGRWRDAWNRPEILGMIAFHNRMQGLPQRCLYEADGYLVLARGDQGLLALNKTTECQNPLVCLDGLRPGLYRCSLSEEKLVLGGAWQELSLPPRQARMWMTQD